MAKKVIIADDHAIIREGLKSLLEKKKGFDVIKIVKNGREAIEFASCIRPDLVMMDVSMPDLNGVEATASIKRDVPDTKVIALSMHSGKKHIDNMFAAGASAYILKESAFEELLEAIDEVEKGNYYISPSIARMYVDSNGNLFSAGEEKPQGIDISKKERQVLQLVAEGEKNKDIAVKMGVSVKTVESHRRNIMKKLNIFNIAGLTKFAIKEGIVSLE